MLASTWMDMVVGVDVHFEMVPTPAGPIPTPFPNPFIGMVIDPAGLSIGLALGAALALATGGTPTGPVLINCMPATNVGTEAKGMGHILIPPGVSWMPMPKFPKPSFRGPPELPGLPVKPEDDAVSIQGSTTVTIMGSSGVRMGEMWMSCGEPLRAPSSVVIAIPKGPLVLVGGPPGINLLDALLAMIKTKWVAGYLHSLISRVKSDRLRNILHKGACFLTGHPVDVATGRVLTSNVDFALPGSLPLSFERNYASSWAHRDGPLGPGWSHSLDQAVWFERGKVVYLAEDGREIEFDVFDLPNHSLVPGQRVHDPINQLTLRFVRSDLLEIETHTGERRAFTPPRAQSAGPRSARWRLQRLSAREGGEIQLSYDARGNLQWVRDSGGRVIGFEHDVLNRLVCVRLPHPVHDGFVEYVRYAYDAEGDLVQVTDAHGASWSFAYKRHLLVRETDRNGLSFYFAYDGWGSDAYCVRTWGDGGIHDHLIDYAKGSLTVVTDSLGHATAYKLGAGGLVCEVLDARGGSTKYEYDERNLKATKVTDPNGGVVSFDYDQRANVSKFTDASGATLHLGYDAHDRLIRARDALGGDWIWAYDASGRLASRSDPTGATTRFEYRDEMLAGVVGALGHRTTVQFDAAGNLVAFCAPDGKLVRYAHDRLGRLVSATDSRGNRTTTEYDLLGRIVSVGSAEDRQLSSYDAEGNRVHVSSGGRDVRFRYSGMGRMIERSEDGATIAFDYDSEERLTSVTNEHGHVFAYELDPVGEIARERGFDGAEQRFLRDAGGRITRVDRASGRFTRYTYDPADRVLAISHSDGLEEQFAYRADGELVRATFGANQLEFELDALGRRLREHQAGAWVGSEFDARGFRRRLTSSLGVDADIERNAMGDSVAVSERQSGYQARMARDDLGLELERRVAGDVVGTWTRDSLGRPLLHEVKGKTSPLRLLSYHWERGNRLRRVIDAYTGPTDYGHDLRGALESVSRVDGSREGRFSDGVGNLFESEQRQDRVYGAAGELRSAQTPQGERLYSYDLDGNLSEKVEPNGERFRYSWNGAGLLSSVTRPDGSEVTFAYDALKRRIKKTHAGLSTHWIWDGDTPLHEWVERDAPQATAPMPAPVTWLFEPDTFTPMCKLVESRPFPIVADHLGTPVLMLDERGERVWSADLDGYGRLRNLHGRSEDCPMRWPGQYEDHETGLYYNRFRYYDPESGRYASQDPIGFENGLALYAYVSDPLFWADPLGLAFARPYSPSDVRSVLDASEGRPTPHNPNNVAATRPGHARRDHVRMSDADLVARTRPGQHQVQRASSFQSMASQNRAATAALNSPAGQAELARFDADPTRTRVVIHADVPAERIRVSSAASTQVHTQRSTRVTVVVDRLPGSGEEIHVQTCH